MTTTEQLAILAQRWNVAIRSPWQSETETWNEWELTLVPREGTWGDYPRFAASSFDEVVAMASRKDQP